MKGHLKVYRKFFTHWLWEENRVYNRPEAFLDLLQLAAFAPTKRVVQGKLVSLEVGELVASERFLELRWKWSRTKVRSFLGILESDQMLDRRKDQGETVLILSNYKDFHECRTEEKTTSNTAKKTPKEPEESHKGTGGEPNKKKDKNLEELEERKKTPKPPRGIMSAVQKAENIYQAYPRKQGKQAAIKAIMKQLKNHEYEYLISKTRAYAESRVGQSEQFTPNPSTWFNQGRFDDDPRTWPDRDSGIGPKISPSQRTTGEANAGRTFGGGSTAGTNSPQEGDEKNTLENAFGI